MALTGEAPDAKEVDDVQSAAACADACTNVGEDCDTFIYHTVCVLYKGAELKHGNSKFFKGKFGGWCPSSGENPVTCSTSPT